MKKTLSIVLLIALMVGAPFAYNFYQNIFSDNSAGEDKELFIPTGSTFADVIKILQEQQAINKTESFEQVAAWMKYKEGSIKPGHYVIEAGKSNKEIITMLRSGNQTPMKLTINNVRTLADLAGTMSKYIESDSLSILQRLQDANLQRSYGKNPNTMMTLFLPDTYEVFWTTKVDKVIEKLANHTSSFWEKNKGKLGRIGLSEDEAYTMASIVEQESNLAAERPTVAGVYLNRIKTGMRLQADPTVKFAMQDFGLKRILLKHLEFDSPYNTYMYAGLPPGPICMPSMSSLNAVINAEDHEFLFFCAKPGYNAGHVFAETLSEHNNNANVYQDWLTSEGIF